MNLISEWIDYVARKFTVAAVALMSLVIGLQIFTRYLLGFSYSWTEEVARYLFIWVTFIGGSIAIKRSMLTKVEFFTDMLPPGVSKWAGISARVLVAIFLAQAAIYGSKLLMTTGVHIQISPAMQIPMKWVYLGVPLGCFMMFYQNLVLLINDLIQVFSSATFVADNKKEGSGPK